MCPEGPPEREGQESGDGNDGEDGDMLPPRHSKGSIPMVGGTNANRGFLAWGKQRMTSARVCH
jgi:hypothetical protein